MTLRYVLKRGVEGFTTSLEETRDVVRDSVKRYRERKVEEPYRLRQEYGLEVKVSWKIVKKY